MPFVSTFLRLVSLDFFLVSSLSLSPFLTHTHMHTHTQAPITESFKLAERHEAAHAAAAAAAGVATGGGGGGTGPKAPRWRSDYEAEMTFM